MKRALNQFFFFISILSFFMLASCGGVVGIDPSLYYTSEQMSLVQSLSVEERTIATRICYAYQSKSSTFRSKSYDNGTFTFDINSKNCEDTRTNYTVNSVFKSLNSSLTFVPETDKPFKSIIQTDKVGYLSQLCEKMFNNMPVSNTVAEANMTIQISFSRETLDSYTIKYFIPAVNSQSNLMKIESMETYKVITKPVLGSGQIKGMDESYSSYKTCETSDKFSEYSQKFSSFKKN